MIHFWSSQTLFYLIYAGQLLQRGKVVHWIQRCVARAYWFLVDTSKNSLILTQTVTSSHLMLLQSEYCTEKEVETVSSYLFTRLILTKEMWICILQWIWKMWQICLGILRMADSTLIHKLCTQFLGAFSSWGWGDVCTVTVCVHNAAILKWTWTFEDKGWLKSILFKKKKKF